uniref:Uncharacterized protein n=1 Tax=Chromera velia CCMP2878 TaxID=1169474 RepID=A0A0G4I789_9ALVE|eukprot:Cvel_11621.t1-p1 / transcript=Cvel_11621.t1 / gene=Cvel_11621 / organism=Chromera_velia_CCMP2878 / gene_product=hypothetical protein / transcript_product=hypothetical protein / location=Cvel_scaffold736:12381-14443(+) / protein_length=170 / sequence_SO=supercontig / SO=protein_coding / is_pseudo=false
MSKAEANTLGSVARKQKTDKKEGNKHKLGEDLAVLDFSKVGESCKKVMTYKGNLLAVPHVAVKPWPVAPPPPVKSEYADRHAPKPIVSAGSGSAEKPLEPYNTNAARNRLKTDEIRGKAPFNSQIKFGGRDPRQFVSEQKNKYRGFGGTQSQNSSIVADKTRFFKQLQNM